MITLHYNNTTIDIHEDDSSYRYRALKQKPQLVLKFSLPKFIEFPVGTWCEFQNERYYLQYPENLKKNGTRDIEYTMTMGTDVDKLSDYKMRNSIDHRLKWSMCARPEEFIKEIVAELNAREGNGVWSVGECIDSTEKTVEFNHQYIFDALSSIADTFDTEWEIIGHSICLHKVEYFKDDPLPLAYGKGNGFIPGVGRTTPSNEKPIKRLYVQGGTDNIDRSKYGSSELLLPKSQSYTYEGRTYKVDADGYYIQRTDKVSDATKDDSVDLSEIYPSRVGTVSSVETLNKSKNYYDIIDNSIPDALNYSDCIIDGETPTIIFQSGMLAGDGKEFEFKYKHSERRFEIVPQEIDGITMPNETFKPKEGDKYAIFGIMLPDAYICDNKSQSGASWDMFKEACKHLYENEEQKFTFTGTLQGLWAKKNWLNIGGRMKVGSYILFKDEQFAKEGVKIRITGIKDFLNKPYSPTIEISNSVSGSSVASSLNKIDTTDVTIDDTKHDILNFTKRRFRDAKETSEMLQNALLNYGASINPITVQTMQALVGDESLQFDYIQSVSSPSKVIGYPFRWNSQEKRLTSVKCAIKHYSLGIADMTPTHEDSEYKKWTLAGLSSAILSDATRRYFLYLKCPYNCTFDANNIASAMAEPILSETAIEMQPDGESSYYFLAGILSSEYEGERSFAPMNGFTEITPGQIILDRILSKNGKSFWDMVNNAFHIGNDTNFLDFNTSNDGKLVLNGTMVQRGGVQQPIVMYRGMFSSSIAYSVNDVVYYKDSQNKISSYICIKNTSAGIAPTNTDYWEPFAQGVKGDSIKGDTGNQYKFVYKIATSTPSKPTYTTYPFIYSVGDWQENPPTGVDYTHFLYMSYAVLNPNNRQLGEWSTPVRISGANGETGKDGSDIEFIYCRRSVNSCPNPSNNATKDDYVPTESVPYSDRGWRDNPSGVNSTYQYEFVAVRIKPRGATSWQNYSSPALWSKWGEKGQDGDGMEYIFQRTEFEIQPATPTSSNSDGYIPTGWTDDPTGVNADYPIEWVSIRKKSDGVWKSFSSPTVWNRYNIWNPNLLEQTEFESSSRMNKWVEKSAYSNSSADDNIEHIQKGGKDGRNFYSDINTKRYSESNHKEVLQQILWNGSDVRKLQPQTWYTLSFYSRQGANNLQINKTSNEYGFAEQKCYLFAGHRYTFVINGRISSTAVTKGKSLTLFIFDSGRNWSKSIQIKKEGNNDPTKDTEKSIVFADVPKDGEYLIDANLYPNDSDRSSVDYGTATLNWLRLVDESEIGMDYVYPKAVDAGVQGYLDGKKVSFGSDMGNSLVPNNSWEWQRHIISFKTKKAYSNNADFDGVQYLLFRMRSTPISGQQNYLQICQPKLEVGKIATGYSPNGDDMRTEYQEIRFAKNGSITSAPDLNKDASEPNGWTTTQPKLNKLEYLWMIVAKKYADGTLLERWSDPVRVTPYDGTDGDSPVLVFRGIYDSSKIYYGNKYRVDAVKYQNIYYLARTDAGEFSGVLPTDTSKWNNFGAQFESVATELLLAEEANIAGWVFRNNRLESQNTDKDGNPMAYLNGIDGTARLRGTLQLSTGFDGNISDKNLFYLPARTTDYQRHLSMGYEEDDIGKVVRLYNASEFGGGSYVIDGNYFGISGNMSYSFDTVSYYIRPKEIVEMTCFERQGSTQYSKQAEWVMTNRMSVQDFKHASAIGRYPLMVAMGNIFLSQKQSYDDKFSISGYLYDSRSLGSICTIRRTTKTEGDTNIVRVIFPNGVLPNNYCVFTQGHGDGVTISIIEKTSTYFSFLYFGDQKYDKSFDFMILEGDWYYETKK